MDNPQGNTVSEVGASTELVAAAENLCAVADTVWMTFSRGEAQLLRNDFERLSAAMWSLREALAKATGTTDTHRDSVNEQRAGREDS